MGIVDGQRAMNGFQLSLGLDAGPAAWNVRRSPRARRLSVRVYPGGRVEVVVPRGVGARLVQRFVVGHSDWISRKIDEMRALAPARSNRLPTGIELAAINEIWSVRVEANGRSALQTGTGRELVLVCRENDDLDAKRLLQGWLRAKARATLEPWLARVAAETGIDFERLEIRRQRTRWGSCSRGGAVSLNACLLFQRPEVVRYLLVHELCHRPHLNHSHRFWGLVARHEPEFRALDLELGQGWRRVPDWVFAA
jgi:predicted metal-dependent hydrolase